MAKKYFTDESLSALVNEIKSGDAKSLSSAKSYTDTEIAKKANSSHTHDDRYYTESEIDTALASKASSTHNHDSAYDTKGAAASALASAKTYADSAATKVKNDLLNGAGTAYDTLKELGDLIDVNVDAIDALETVAAGKADKTHSHAISDVTGLQSALDGKAASSHGTHVTFDSTNKPKMDGTAAFGTSTKVARADHVHPTDTSRAAQTDLDALETVVNGKASASHTHAISDITNLQTSLDAKQATITGGASTIASSNLTASRALISNSSGKVAVSAVTSTELGYLDGVTSAIQTQLDGKAATSHGNHVPTTQTANNAKFLRNDNTWQTVTPSNIGAATSGHTHISLSGWSDTRSVDTIPNDYNSKFAVSGLKSNATIGISDGGTYSGVVGFRSWSDSSGGNSQEIAFAANGNLYRRYGATTEWGNWLQFIDSGNIGSQSVASATKATQLTTARTIALGTGVTGTATSFNGTGNITIPVTDIKESYLSWGGKNLTGSVSPVSAALSTEHSANRIAYLNPNAIKIEYSNDAGSTWTDSGLGNSAKVNLVTTSNAVSVGSNSTVTTNHRTRMTFTGQDGTNGYVYTRPRKLLINVSTPHGLTVTIEAKTGASGASWTTLGTYNLSGWSGWNDIPLGISTFGGGTNQTGNYWYIRLTFANTSVNSSYTTTKSSIIGLRLFGDTCWTRTSNMGETGHLYSYDYAQNATFPAQVTATTLNGTTFSGSGVATVSEVETYLGI